ncbi:MAG: ATP-binding protein [Bacteroidetes bacterium]|nr:ATP-binding protein [Bacteroidota bacterium]MCZ6694695.1 ATP-binding protein [Bacteroidota bacterium]
MDYRYNCQCSKEKLKKIREFVSEVLHKYNLTEVKINELVLAVDEVCANLIIHSHNCNPQESFEIKINVNKKEGITFYIIDDGKIGFNLNQYKEPSINELIKKQKKGGVGLILVKRIMDDIQFKCSPERNVCRLFKKLKIHPTS